MIICAASDLHVDIGSSPPIQWPEADALVIAGDTANTIGGVAKLAARVEKLGLYPTILMVDGNHEHYSNAPQGRTLEQTLERLDNALPSSVTLLPLVDHHVIDGVYFVGVNGWYSCDLAGDPAANRARWKETMNDDRWIGFTQMGLAPPWELAEQQALVLEKRLQNIVDNDGSARIVVVTHTAPCRETLSQLPQHLFDNCFYANLFMERVMEEFTGSIKLWVHGHTHYRQEKIVKGIPVLVNPRGYPGENNRWEPVTYEI